MVAARYPKAVWLGNGYTTGSYTGGPWKLVLHTTETSGVPTYNSGRSAPHITYYPRTRKFYQHIDLTDPARALRDLEGGVATNRDSVLQLEIVCYSQESVVDQYPNTGRVKVSELSEDNLNDIREFCRWAADEFGIPWQYPSSNARMSVATYDGYAGFLGHKHVPENDHWDPGAIRHEAIFTEEDEMYTGPTAQEIAKAVHEYPSLVTSGGQPISAARLAKWTYDNGVIARAPDLSAGDVQAIADAITADLGVGLARALGEKLIA